jgi:hypothetical protein
MLVALAASVIVVGTNTAATVIVIEFDVTILSHICKNNVVCQVAPNKT